MHWIRWGTVIVLAAGACTSEGNGTGGTVTTDGASSGDTMSAGVGAAGSGGSPASRGGSEATSNTGGTGLRRGEYLFDTRTTEQQLALLDTVAEWIAGCHSAELVPRARELGTDFAVAEACDRYDECADYQAHDGDLVFVIEYRESDFARGCSGSPGLPIVLHDLNLTTPGSSSYVFDGC